MTNETSVSSSVGLNLGQIIGRLHAQQAAFLRNSPIMKTMRSHGLVTAGPSTRQQIFAESQWGRLQSLEAQFRQLRAEHNDFKSLLNSRGIEHGPSEPSHPKAVGRVFKDRPNRERSLLRMVLAMAMDKYGYNPGAKRQATAKQISHATELAGCRVDDDTIRIILNEARAHYEPGD